MKPIEVAEVAVKALENKKAENIQSYEVGSFLGFTDYIVIATGRSVTQLKALAQEVEKELFGAGEEIIGVEGKGDSNWILVDSGTVVVHLFTEDARFYYELDSLYKDAMVFEDNSSQSE